MDIIRKYKMKLIDWLCGEEIIVQSAQSEELITSAEYAKIRSVSDPRSSTTELIDMIMRKGNQSCIDFLELLKKDHVNESRPELREWITTVNTSGLADKKGDTTVPQANSVGITDHQEFLKRNHRELVNNVKNVDGIVDDLMICFTDEKAAKVRAEQTDHDKMRKVLVYSKVSKKAAKTLVDALYKHEPDVMEDLTTA